MFTIYKLLTAFGIAMLYMRQESNYAVSFINKRIFCVQTLTEVKLLLSVNFSLKRYLFAPGLQ